MSKNPFAATRAFGISPLYFTQKQPVLNSCGILTAAQRKQALALAKMPDSAPSVVEYLQPFAKLKSFDKELSTILRAAKATVSYWAKSQGNTTSCFTVSSVTSREPRNRVPGTLTLSSCKRKVRGSKKAVH